MKKFVFIKFSSKDIPEAVQVSHYKIENKIVYELFNGRWDDSIANTYTPKLYNFLQDNTLDIIETGSLICEKISEEEYLWLNLN